MRKIFGVLAGIAVAMLLIATSDWVASALFPVNDVDFGDPAVLSAYIADMPIVAKLTVVVGSLIAPFGGAWLCLRIADWAPGGWIVTAVFLLSGLVNQYAVPHPFWMQLCALLLPLIGGWLAQRFHRKPYPGEPLLG